VSGEQAETANERGAEVARRSRPGPAVPTGPVVTLIAKVRAERREEALALLRETIEHEEAHGGIRVGVYESVDEPGQIVQLIAYANVGDFVASQRRIEDDASTRARLERFGELLVRPIEVLRAGPLSEALAPARSAPFAIEDASFNDHAEIASLLETSGLPVPNAEDAGVRFLVARQAGALLGCIGWERYGPRALLRSLAVRETERKRGLGASLVEALWETLAPRGVSELYLLTKTAAGFFASQGFVTIERSAVPETVRASRQFKIHCCDDALVMKCEL
jgi:amino-acid N-acetyltransferase